jgi:hypothetical protein
MFRATQGQKTSSPTTTRTTETQTPVTTRDTTPRETAPRITTPVTVDPSLDRHEESGSREHESATLIGSPVTVTPLHSGGLSGSTSPLTTRMQSMLSTPSTPVLSEASRRLPPAARRTLTETGLQGRVDEFPRPTHGSVYPLPPEFVAPMGHHVENLELSLMNPTRSLESAPLVHTDRFKHALEGMMDGTPLPPIKVDRRPNRAATVEDGFHRYYSALALGFSHIPAVVADREPEVAVKTQPTAKWVPRHLREKTEPQPPPKKDDGF